VNSIEFADGARVASLEEKEDTMKLVKTVALFVGFLGWASAGFGAAAFYFHTTAIPGTANPPGYPASFPATAMTVTPHTLTLTRQVDAVSPQLAQAVVSGTPLGTADFLAYKVPVSAPPYFRIELSNALASSYGTNGTSEHVSFATTGLQKFYMELPGVTAESSTPGHAGVMNLQSITVDAAAQTFTITKATDLASPQLLLAAARGTHFPVASGLFYDAPVPGDQPDAVIPFQDVIVSSFQAGGADPGGPTPEVVTFAFADVPEPGALAAGLATVAMCSRSRRGRRGRDQAED
jgi:type VI protein secretion system component Hcp